MLSKVSTFGSPISVLFNIINSTVSTIGDFLYSFSSFSFSTAGSTGYNGPTLEQCLITYTYSLWTKNTSYFNITTRGIQLWTVPTTATYRITAGGAAGGNNLVNGLTGGKGAVITTDVSLSQNQTIAIVVGQKGTNRSNTSSGYYGGAGGGGTFIYDNDTITYYLVSGGGGGAGSALANLLTGMTQANARLDTTGASISITGGYYALGGTSGQGGNKSTRNLLFGGAGAGILSNGATANNFQGKTRINGWLGGFTTSNSTYPIPGGFGGGGGSGNGDGSPSYAIYNWAGGGGGYSGGAAGGNGGQSDGQYGGGGGSYYTGSVVSATVSNINDGYVIIELL